MLAQAGMQLSEVQEEQLLACRRTALQGFGALVAERESLWTQLQVCAPSCRIRDELSQLCRSVGQGNLTQ